MTYIGLSSGAWGGIIIAIVFAGFWFSRKLVAFFERHGMRLLDGTPVRERSDRL